MNVPETRRIAVTGAAGMIGAAVARRLLEDGHELVLLDKRAIVDPPARFVQCDLRDETAVEAALAGVEVVCHIGEVPNLIPGYTPQEVFDTNIAICRTTLDVATRRGASLFIYTSSCQQYGYWGGGDFLRDPPPRTWPMDETQPPSPQNEYAASKAFNEAQCRDASAATGLQTMMFRFPWVIGARHLQYAQVMWDDADRKLAEGFWTYLGLADAVEAYALAVRAGPALEPLPSRSEAFHFVADEVAGTLSTRDKLRIHLPNWPALPQDWPARQPPVTCAKAARHLGWHPRYRLCDDVRVGPGEIRAKQSGR